MARTPRAIQDAQLLRAFENHTPCEAEIAVLKAELHKATIERDFARGVLVDAAIAGAERHLSRNVGSIKEYMDYSEEAALRG